MRRIEGYDGATPRWSENEPSHARMHGVRGEIVKGGPGAYDLQRAVQAAYRAARREQREAAK